MKKTLLAHAAFILSCLSLNPAHAGVMLTGGLTHEYNVNAGSSVNGALELKNMGNEPAEVKIYQEDIKIKADGETEYAPGTGNHPRSNAGWLSLGTDRVTLAPGSSQTIPYTLKVPAGDELQGSYWSMLMVEPVSSSSRESQLAPANDKPSLTIQQKVRYAIQVLTNIGNQGAANLTFADPKVARNEQGTRQLSVNITNTGNLYSRPKVWLDVFDAQGTSKGKLSAEAHGLYAGERETFAIALNDLQPGNYKALLAAEDNNSGQVFGSDIQLAIQP